MTHTHTLTDHHPHPERPGHGPALDHETDLAELLNLDAVLGASVLAEALNAASRALGAAPRRAVDLGAGTGTGTRALATRFPDVTVHSLDASPLMLDRLAAAATTEDVSDRIQTHLVDLDGDWPAVLPGSVDLAWAALSLHHMTDPAQVLRQVIGVLRPGGVLVVTEFTGATGYEPSDLGSGRDGLGERLVTALAERGYPVTAEWTTDLSAAGFVQVQRLESALTASARTPDGARYLAVQLTRNRALLTDGLPAEDLSALDTTIAALESGRSDLGHTSGRVIWIAVRPEGDGR